jgi:hypothetical protein
MEAHRRFIMDGRRDRLRKEKGAAFAMSLLKDEVWRRFEHVMKENETCARLVEEAVTGKADPYSAVERIVKRTAFTISD